MLAAHMEALVRQEEGASLVEWARAPYPVGMPCRKTRRSIARLLPAMRAWSPGVLVAPGLSKSLRTTRELP